MTSSSTRRAHPRSRGENAGGLVAERWEQGSSPLTRGKRLDRDATGAATRLIPAHAGKTPPPESITTASAAHPRSRGENTSCGTVSRPRTGSSPLTRGKHRDAQRPADSPRLIPAHAGKTIRRHGTRQPYAAHPRSRGENPPTFGRSDVGAGSSPLTRGKLRK